MRIDDPARWPPQSGRLVLHQQEPTILVVGHDRRDRRFPGGARRSCNLPAISNCRNLRRATVAIFANRLTRNPFASDSVSAHSNVLITGGTGQERATSK